MYALIYQDVAHLRSRVFSDVALGPQASQSQWIECRSQEKQQQRFNQSVNKIRNIVQMHCGKCCGSGSRTGVEWEVPRVRRWIETWPSSTSLHLFLYFLSLSLPLQETQGETPGSFLRRTQPEGLQHQRTWPTVQTGLSAPVQPPLPQGTAPRPPTSVRFLQPRWSDCVDPIRTGMHAFFENAAPDRMMYDEPRLINLLALVLGAGWATVRGLWHGIKTR